MPGQQRADARRNYSRILAAAEAEVVAHGVDASFEKIARGAGVGSATVRRHFPTRQSLMYAIFGQRIDRLCGTAHQLADAEDSREALLDFLRQVLTYCVDARGLAITLAHDETDLDPVDGDSCSLALATAMEPLLHRAVADGGASPRASTTDLIALVVGIALATERHLDPATRASGLLALAVEGIGAVGPAPEMARVGGSLSTT